MNEAKKQIIACAIIGLAAFIETIFLIYMTWEVINDGTFIKSISCIILTVVFLFFGSCVTWLSFAVLTSIWSHRNDDKWYWK